MAVDYTPRPYMEAAIEFGVSHPCCGLMLDPGLGKTAITLAIITILKAQHAIRRVLVVAPLRVAKATWPSEVSKWGDFRHLRIGTACELDANGRLGIAANPAIDIVTINPESLHKLLEHPEFEKWQFDLLVLDESTKFKNTQAKRFKALKKRLLSFKRRIILTGTPVPNGLEDLFGQMFIVDLGKALGTYVTHFRQRYMYQRPGDIYGYYIRPGADAEIYEKVKPTLMRLQSKHHLDMPELIHNIIPVVLPERLMKQYKELENDYITVLEETPIAAFNPAALGTKLRQFGNGFLYHTDEESQVRSVIELHDAKITALEELVEELQGRPLLLGYEYNADRDRIQAKFPMAVNLGTAKKPEEIIARFNAGLIPIVLGHPASIGHGLNLQEACRDVCWYGDQWDLELVDQFNARVWRQGQPSPFVVIHHIAAVGTRDEKVAAALSLKSAVQENFSLAIRTPL